QKQKLCYSDEDDALTYIKLEALPTVPDLRDPRLADVNLAQAPYWNFTCPWEWSKYSCVHQDQTQRARAALLYSQDMLTGGGCRLDRFDGAAFVRLLGTRQLVFAGDSLSRQAFISAACLLHAAPGVEVREDAIEWSDDWPCHSTVNCIPRGRHSGFGGGCVQFGLAEEPGAGAVSLCFTAADQAVELEHIIKRFAMTPRHDILVMNLGVHLTSDEHALQVQHMPDTWTGDPAARPILVYRETAPQHFKLDVRAQLGAGKGAAAAAAAGMFDADTVAGLAACVPSVDYRQDWRSSPEREGLAGRVPFLAATPFLAQAGHLHVGAGVVGAAQRSQDCTHWCMPGVPDVWSAQLYSYLRAHLAQLEGG
ncbi:hypothetical protein JKP88DRAFT_150007, partial [Tribonema minus]